MTARVELLYDTGPPRRRGALLKDSRIRARLSCFSHHSSHGALDSGIQLPQQKRWDPWTLLHTLWI